MMQSWQKSYRSRAGQLALRSCNKATHPSKKAVRAFVLKHFPEAGRATVRIAKSYRRGPVAIVSAKGPLWK